MKSHELAHRLLAQSDCDVVSPVTDHCGWGTLESIEDIKYMEYLDRVSDADTSDSGGVKHGKAIVLHFYDPSL